MNNFHTLKVIDVINETKKAVSITFAVPKELKNKFSFKPGQYITLELDIYGQLMRRAYSICSSVNNSDSIKIAVKRVKKGLVSNFINDLAQVGDIVDVGIPDGHFFVNVKAENCKTYYLFASGSGITPILSILKSVLQTEKNSVVHLIYGNKNEQSIMFKSELDNLLERYHNRFTITHSLSKPKKSFWSKKNRNTFTQSSKIYLLYNPF